MRTTNPFPRPAGRVRTILRGAIGTAVLMAALCAPGPAHAVISATGSHRVPWVAYQASLRDGQFGVDGIFLVRPDGSQDHEILTAVPGQHIHPDWSADGRTLAFRADVTDQSQLYLVDPFADPTGRRARQLTRCGGDCVQVDDAALSPDGTRIAYVEVRGPFVVVDQVAVPTAFLLRVARLTPRGLADVRTVVSTTTVTEIVGPRWSPDGRSLVYWADRVDPASATLDGTAVFTVRADGTHRQQLTAWSMFAGEADWSPDGRRIVFDTHPLLVFNFDAVVSNLYTVRPDGTGMRQLTHSDTVSDRSTQPRWTPHGRIVYTRVTPDGRALWLRDADRGHPVEIAPGGRRIRTHGDVQPT
jgi:Tol biopolymer transport system component